MDSPAAVEINGDLLLISPTVKFSEFIVVKGGLLKIISKDPTSTDP